MCGRRKRKRSSASLQSSSNGGAPMTQSKDLVASVSVSRGDEDAEALSEVLYDRITSVSVPKLSSREDEDAEKLSEVLYDPITMDIIDDAANRQINLNGHKYDIVTLAQYFFASKDFRDPLTRQSLTEDQIIDIDMHSFSFMTTVNNAADTAAGKSVVDVLKAPWNYGVVKESALSPMPPDVIPTVTPTESPTDDVDTVDSIIDKPSTPSTGTAQSINLPSLLPIFRKVSAGTCSEMQNKEKTLQTLDNIIGGLISEVMDILEEDAADDEEGMDDFHFSILRIISELEYPWKELKSLDHEAAYLYMQSYLAFLQGSTKKPTKDPHNRIPYILNMLNRQCLTKDDISRHMDERRERSMSYDATIRESEDVPIPLKRNRAESV